ncbi:MAG: RrF2 family transcriptional regulator, partial [Candidatus Hinthialibacter sp.]
ILATLYLAQVYDTDNVRTLEEISNDETIPHPFLVQILLELKRAGIVESKRGAGGGYRLARHPRDISLSEVIRLIDGPILPFKCTTPSLDASDECIHQGNCVLNSVWHDLRETIESIIGNISFEELVQRRENMNAPMYHI